MRIHLVSGLGVQKKKRRDEGYINTALEPANMHWRSSGSGTTPTPTLPVEGGEAHW